MPATSTRSWLGTYLALGLVWGCSFLFIKDALRFLTPFGVAFARCALGAITLLCIAAIRRVALPRDPVVWFHLWIVALCLNVIPGVLFAVAETRTTSIVAGIINALTPLTSLFFIAVIFRDEPVQRYQLIGLGVGLLGVLLVLGVWRGFGPNPWWAVAALLFSVILYGLSFPYSRRFVIPRRLDPVTLASTQVVLAALTLTPTFLFDGTNGHSLTLKAGLAVLALGVFGSGFAYIWNFRVLAAAGSAIASTVTYLTPVVAVFAGVLFLHEPLTWFEPIGGLVVLLGAAIGQGRLRRTTQTLRS
ncbi:MAG: EamA-like transporter family protein [Acidimicrobiaceae bacterium]|nr:EamA-like transporter family protein [Acidimicrobiaceae bacterium]